MQAMTLTEAIQEAVSKEKEDIGMYKALMQLVPSNRPDMAEAIQHIMNDEANHMKVLRSFLDRQPA